MVCISFLSNTPATHNSCHWCKEILDFCNSFNVFSFLYKILSLRFSSAARIKYNVIDMISASVNTPSLISLSVSDLSRKFLEKHDLTSYLSSSKSKSPSPLSSASLNTFDATHAWAASVSYTHLTLPTILLV